MKLFFLSDMPIPSGFGRISGEVFLRLAQRGYEVSGASVLWDGVMPIDAPAGTPFLHRFPFKIAGLAGRDVWSYAGNLIQMAQPDIVVVCQDFPYAQTLYHNCRIDWSKRALLNITPIDGEPINTDWLNLCDDVDATMVISKFGVEAMKRAGKQVELCHPGVDTRTFRPASAEEKTALRAKAGIAPDAFLLGMAAMNQGRKAIPHTIEGFWRFAQDKQNAYLLLDMDKVSGAGWDLPKLAQHIGVPDGRILYKDDLQGKGLNELRDRFVIMDAHSVLSHREGFGLPLLESQACRIPTLAMDWCSGTEIVGENKGFLVKTDSGHRFSTWGNAKDYDPDLNSFVAHLETIYSHPLQAAGIADIGYEWARQQTWDKAADAVEETLIRIYAERQKRGQPITTATIGTASTVRVGDSVDIQPTPVRVETVPEPSAVLEPLVEGSNSGGRREHGIRPARTDWASDDGDSQSEQYAIRQDLQLGGESGNGRPAPIPELGHRSNGELAGAAGQDFFTRLTGEFLTTSGGWLVTPEEQDFLAKRKWNGDAFAKWQRAGRSELTWESGSNGSKASIPAD